MIYIDVNRSSHEEAVEPGRADSPEPARFPTHFDDERPLLVAVAAPPSQSVGEGIAGMRPAATVSPQGAADHIRAMARRSEEHTSELQSLMRISYAVFCLKKKKDTNE